jgi:hypothetical protein
MALAGASGQAIESRRRRDSRSNLRGLLQARRIRLSPDSRTADMSPYRKAPGAVSVGQSKAMWRWKAPSQGLARPSQPPVMQVMKMTHPGEKFRDGLTTGASGESVSESESLSGHRTLDFDYFELRFNQRRFGRSG